MEYLEYWRGIANGAFALRGLAANATAIEKVIKTGRRVKLTGTLEAKDYPDAELFFMTLQLETEAGYVCKSLCIKLHGGKNAVI